MLQGPRPILKRLQSFGLCFLFQVLLPCAPLVAEYVRSGIVRQQSINLFAALYVMGLGLSSKIPIVWGLGLFCGFILAVVFGVTDVGGANLGSSGRAPWFVPGTVLGVVIGFLSDRIYFHVVLGSVFPPFEQEDA